MRLAAELLIICFDLPCSIFKREREKKYIETQAIDLCQSILIPVIEIKLRHHPSHPVSNVTPGPACRVG